MSDNQTNTLETLSLAVSGIDSYLLRPYHDSDLLTDYMARLTTLDSELTKQTKAGKDMLKKHMSTQQVNILLGRYHQATLSTQQVVRLDTERVKSFLGKRLIDYQIISEEQRLLFKARG